MRRQFAALRIERVATPVSQAGRRIAETFPPRSTIFRYRDVGVNAVVPNCRHRVRIRLAVRARRDAEESEFGIDRPQSPVRSRA